MLVRGVTGVTYDELGEIELANGERRRGKVLEIDGGNALVQLFENATGINLESSKVRFLGRTMELGVSEDRSCRSSQRPVFPMPIWRLRLPVRQKCAERMSPLPLYLPQWELPLRKPTSSWKVLRKPEQLTAALCLSIWQTTRQ